MRASISNRPLIFAVSLTTAATLCLPAAAQNQTQRRQTPVAPQNTQQSNIQQTARPALDLVARDIRVDRAAISPKSLTIASLVVDVKIVGDLVETTLTAEFTNPNEQVLEGEFTLDLPREAYVTGFALDINGTLIDGVLQPKAKAAEAYEENLRRGVDPGLGEINAANQFATRIFPINPRSGRTVKISYVSALDANGAYVLPLTTAGAVGRATLNISNNGRGRPTLVLPAGLRASTGPEALQDGYGQTLGRFSGENVQLRGDLKVSNVGAPEDVTVTIDRGGDQYFSFLVPPAPISATKPKIVRLYWDGSRSRRDDDLAKEISLLEAYVAQVQPERLELIVFSDGAPVTLNFGRGDMATLGAKLRDVRYQGASRFGGLEGLGQSEADVCLLFSDGQLTMDAFSVKSWPCRVMTVSTSPRARRDVLEGLANTNRGAFIDLKAASVADALRALGARGPDLRGLTTSRGESVAYDVTPTPNGQFRVIGPRGQADDLVVKTYGPDRQLSLRNAAGAGHRAAAAFWGASQIKRLSATDNPDTDQLLAAVRHYGVATPDYSFIVLETLEDYARNNIAPSPSIGKEFLTQYQARRAQIEATERDAKALRFQVISTAWTEQKTWWKTRFNPQTQPKTTPDQSGQANGADRDARQLQRPTPVVGAPPPPPPPSPPPQEMSGMVSDAAAAAPQRRVRATPTQAGAGLRSEIAPPSGPQQGAANAQSPVLPPSSNITITAAAWNPDRPYLRTLTGVKPGDEIVFDAIYKAQEVLYGDTPAFYFDMAEWAFRNGLAARAAGIARNALELTSTSLDTKIILAARLIRYGAFDQAIWLNERILQATPGKPQALRNLALALVARADARASTSASAQPQNTADYERALGLLMKIVLTPNGGDYDGIELIALMEANHIVPKLKALGVTESRLAELIDPRLMALLTVDIRVTLEWNTDKTDMDLWVDEPTGERAIYSNPRTAIGGHLSNDMTRGYGPEEYLLNVAPNGQYKVQANAFASDRLDPNGPTSLTVRLYRDWGKPTEKVESFVVELTRGQQPTVEIGRFNKGQ
jgi:Vault protein inter-alpha-trypsin domain/Uncharacterized protein conserved in bacteria (DUF2135)